MMRALPFFSVIIPTYNRASQLKLLLGQVLRQSFLDFEVVIVDDGSVDDTESLFRDQNDERVRFFKIENRERGGARNYGADMARGRYLNFFDSDDEMLPSHLQFAFDNLSGTACPILCHSYMNRDMNGVLIGPPLRDLSARALLFDNFLSINSVFVRADIFNKYRFCEDRRLASSEDWQLWIRLSARIPFRFTQDVTSYVNFHPNRSLLTIKASRVVERDRFLIKTLRLDCEVMRCYGLSFRKFVADRYTYFMLIFSQERDLGRVVEFAVLAVIQWPLILANKRFLASLRNILLDRRC